MENNNSNNQQHQYCDHQGAAQSYDHKEGSCKNYQGALQHPKRWSRHGSTRYIWNQEQFQSAMIYVKDYQGEMMTYFESPKIDLKQLSTNPLAYFITFHTYGTWLHGDPRGSVDSMHNAYGTPMIPSSPSLYKHKQDMLSHSPYFLDEPGRVVVLKAIIEVCHYRNWHLHSIHVRNDHVHVIVSANARPEKVMNDFKAYASRALNIVLRPSGSSSEL